ncbi:MAG: carbohydate-binding domain-containing protein, partial [Asticcacaulis sp.]|nr:carbohydate-binding domain-containing protein [Asticcacaulis sp.]
LFATTALTPVNAAPTSPQARLDAFAHDLGYRFAVVDNTATDGFVSEIRLTLPKTLPASGWSIYIGMVNPVRKLDSDAFDIQHINGDLYRLTPRAALTPGATYILTLHADGHFFSQFHVMPNAYVAADGLKVAVIAATKPARDSNSGQEILPFVAPMTDAAKLQTVTAADHNVWKTPERLFAETEARRVANATPEFVILPTPSAVKRLDGSALDLSHGVKITGNAVPSDIDAALDDLEDAGVRLSDNGLPIDIAITGQGQPESYHLTGQNGKIAITAADSAGAAYALESLGQQAAYEHNHLRPLEITDAPRFGFRGLHIDLARNFESKQHVLDIITQMERYKLNRLHLHLGDDEGWRLAIDGLPELTDIGSKRCHDLAEDHCLLPQLGAGPDGAPGVNGYLTRDDYIEILKAAKARHIEVIPSFDMPGHSRAAVRSMEARYRRLTGEGKTAEAGEYRLQDPTDTTVYDSIQHYNDNTLNICLPSTYHFIDKVVSTIASYHQAAGAPLKRYHIGADETAGAWTGSPACQALMKDQNLTAEEMTPYFIEKVADILAGKDIEPAGWSDGMSHVDPAKMPKIVQSNSWGGLFGGGIAEAYSHANRGWDVVMSTPDVLYFDMPQASDPAERGYDWASRETSLFNVFAFMPENLA